MLGEGLDAASAGYRVGYGNASHFTREYKRVFGAPPMRAWNICGKAPGKVWVQELFRSRYLVAPVCSCSYSSYCVGRYQPNRER
jgi:AraC-like DNA-binding protein